VTATTVVADVVGAGRPVLALHGQPGHAGDWAPVVAELRDRYRVVVPDRPGYGRTGGAAGGFGDNARLLAGLLRDLALGPAIVVAHSWAGGVALALALDQPDVVGGLVLLAPVSPVEPVALTDRLLASRPVGDAMTAAILGPGLRMLLRPTASRWILARTPPATRTAIRGLGAALPVDGRAWRSFSVEQRAFVTELPAMAGRLADIDVPTVLATGLGDHLVRPAEVVRLSREIPRSRLAVWPGVGHLLPIEAPGPVGAAVDTVARWMDRRP
jgi:pimeloyl-ACP methyl ester carboxylesterase